MDKPSLDVYLLQQPKLVLERRNIKEKGLCETRWVVSPAFILTCSLRLLKFLRTATHCPLLFFL